MNHTPGWLRGVGVGPGDPELLTIKAAGVIRSADVVAFHSGPRGDSIARRIAGVGWVTVSERRSIRGIPGRIARGAAGGRERGRERRRRRGREQARTLSRAAGGAASC